MFCYWNTEGNGDESEDEEGKTMLEHIVLLVGLEQRIIMMTSRDLIPWMRRRCESNVHQLYRTHDEPGQKPQCSTSISTLVLLLASPPRATLNSRYPPTFDRSLHSLKRRTMKRKDVDVR